jgi:hypothetical protein
MISHFKFALWVGVVVHICNPICSGGSRDKRFRVQGPPRQKFLETPILIRQCMCLLSLVCWEAQIGGSQSGLAQA